MMKLLRRQFLHLAAGAAALPAMPHIARAQAYPTRPVRIVVPFAAGGSADVLARLVAQHLSANLKQQFVVENRPGGGGMLGTQQFLATPSDGYTIGMTNLSTLSLVPVINATATYDALNDFTHIAYIGGAPVVLAANPKTGVRTLEQFVAYSRAPGKAFTFASSGVGSDGHLMGEAIAAAVKVKTEHVPYRGAGPALTDIVAGHVPFSTFTLSSTAPFIRDNSLYAIAITSPGRMPDFLEVPTFKELGWPELVGTTWFSLSGPKGLAKDVVDRINREVVSATSTPEIQARFRRDGFIAQRMTAAEFTKFVAEENARWKIVIEPAGLLGSAR
jgi:tripartite-type tricarboxylate transporter receptor subunit TctC